MLVALIGPLRAVYPPPKLFSQSFEVEVLLPVRQDKNEVLLRNHILLTQ